MTIHHATVKRAASLGIVLSDETGTPVAFHAERNRTIENDDPKAALAFCLVAAKLAIEYPGITINDDGEAFLVDSEDNESFYEIDPEASLDDSVAALLEALPEGADVEGEDDESTGIVIVADRYKKEYAARGDASGCGDWLHRSLKRYSTEANLVADDGKKTKSTVFDEPSFTAMLIANGVAVKGKFADMPNTGKKGWEGRYRMNGRQMLEAPLLRNKGILQLENGTDLTMPSEDYDALISLPRHKALKEALETAEDEADAAAEQAA